jgi:hypothetical protein
MAKFTSATAALFGSKGGKTTVTRHGRTHMQRIGKRGFWATVHRHWNGDARAFVNYRILLGLAATDPVPGNGAFLHDRAAIREHVRSGIGDKLPPTWTPPSLPDAPAPDLPLPDAPPLTMDRYEAFMLQRFRTASARQYEVGDLGGDIPF